ncbi:DNA-3-methyladenine glycosylase family protein [Paenibacillus caui]|uniref:DNA-3-methyladenine glycosylase family protein n=1 Tax=Paenibacillus caui TaxID=2873927 RepID=UPI001CA99F34|nr:DNA-3-methyladenine glycosylase 2 family protein [Paenibacillus caui]
MPRVETKYFDYGQAEMDFLSKRDAALGAAITRMGKVERSVIPDLFSALVYAIIGQLISVKAAKTVWDNMQHQLGEISPNNLSKQTPGEIQRCGITMKKAVCIHQIAMTIEEGALDLEELHRMSDDEVIRRLTGLNGVGRWTAEMLLINSMERRDIVSWGDAAIRRGMMKLYGLDQLTKRQFDEYRLCYSPYGSVASIYLWEISFE